jgi:hypothetical protein
MTEAYLDARDENSVVSGVVCATNGSWGSAQGRWLREFGNAMGSNNGIAFKIDSRSLPNVSHQIGCVGDGTPGTIWVCLHERTVVVSLSEAFCSVGC